MFRKKAESETAAYEAERLMAEVGVVRAVLRRYRPGTRVHFGAPTRCPRCGDYGFANRVDRARGVAHNHCLSCDADWVLTQRALIAVERDPSLIDDLYPPEEEPEGNPDEQLLIRELQREYEPPTERAPDAPVPEAAPPLVPEGIALEAQAAALPANGPEPAPLSPSPVVNGGGGLRILVVEDNPFDLALLEELLDAGDTTDVELLHAPTRTDGERLAAANAINLVLLDLNLPDSSGIDSLVEWQRSRATIAPVIVMSGSSDADLIQQARALGAVHFVQKNHLVDLADQGASGSARLLRILRSTAATVTSF